MNKKAIVLLSGGLDSTTVLAIVKNLGYEVYALSFFYGQRHAVELDFAKKIAEKFEVKEHKIAKIDLRIFGGSALTDEILVPKNRDVTNSHEVPITYVPARNTIFLSYCLAYAEVVGAFDIFIGVNAIDYSGYPDCREDFIKAFEKMANLATASAIDGRGAFRIHAPLQMMTKKDIIETGLGLGIDYSMTYSCYDPIIENGEVKACEKCDSCTLRRQGFEAALVNVDV